MRKGALTLKALLITVLIFVSVSIASAGPNRAVECGLDITYDEHEPGVFYWLGTLSDCELAGTIRFDAVPEEYAETGKALHFVEEFTIQPFSGGEIKGKNWGVWNFSTFKFRAHGWVRETSPEWAHLIGAKYHEIGTTTPYYGNPEDLPIYAPGGSMKMVPTNRPPHALP